MKLLFRPMRFVLPAASCLLFAGNSSFSVATLPPSSELLRRYETQFQLSGRITMLGFADKATASFRDPAVARRMKLEVKRILELDVDDSKTCCGG